MSVDVDNLRRSNRTRNPPNSVFARDFVGELWEKLQIRADTSEGMEGRTVIDVHDINPAGQASISELIEQHKQDRVGNGQMEELKNMTNGDEEEIVPSVIEMQLKQQYEENKDLLLLIDVLQDKVKRLEGKGRLETEKRNDEGGSTFAITEKDGAGIQKQGFSKGGGR